MGVRKHFSVSPQTSQALLISTPMSSKTPCKTFISNCLNCLDSERPVSIKTPLTSLRIGSNEIEQSADDIRAELVVDEDEEVTPQDENKIHINSHLTRGIN